MRYHDVGIDRTTKHRICITKDDLTGPLSFLALLATLSPKAAFLDLLGNHLGHWIPGLSLSWKNGDLNHQKEAPRLGLRLKKERLSL
jgi:hypothetical protein